MKQQFYIWYLNDSEESIKLELYESMKNHLNTMSHKDIYIYIRIYVLLELLELNILYRNATLKRFKHKILCLKLFEV